MDRGSARLLPPSATPPPPPSLFPFCVQILSLPPAAPSPVLAAQYAVFAKLLWFCAFDHLAPQASSSAPPLPFSPSVAVALRHEEILFRPSPYTYRQCATASAEAASTHRRRSSSSSNSSHMDLLKAALQVGKRACEEALGVLAVTHRTTTGSLLGEVSQLQQDYAAALGSVLSVTS